MFIDLIEILQNDEAKKSKRLKVERKEFTAAGFQFLIVDSDVKFDFNNAGNKTIHVTCQGEVVIQAPCFKCLEPVNFTMNIDATRDMDMKKTAEEKIADLDEENYLDGTVFDTEVFVFNEILVNLPMKVLCTEECKGICNRCGANLNHGCCDCDTVVPDSRMSKILDVFNQFKEV